MLIEQAIFTSAKTDRAQGYQLLGRSPHLSEIDIRELSVWGPSHGSLLEQDSEGGSANFFRLSSGAYCISRTVTAGDEYSGRGELIYTQFLVVPPELLARFANNPFAILRAAAASGVLCVHEVVPEILEPVHLGGRSPVVDLGLVAQLALEPGPAAMATLVQAALASDRLAIYATTPAEQLIAGLFNVLPVECRAEFSFATGLKHSHSRPVRLSALPPDEAAWRAVARDGITLLRLDESSPTEVSWQGWAAWVAAVLEAGKFSLLATELEQPRPGLTCQDLDALGNQLLARLRGEPEEPDRPVVTPIASVAEQRGAKRKVVPIARRQRADRAHAAFQGTVADAPSVRTAQLDALAEKLARQPANVLEMLERIDDLVFASISGDRRALAELEVLWPLTASELDADLVEQSREQYLRCALSICSDLTETEGMSPERALAAVDVLCVLFEE